MAGRVKDDGGASRRLIKVLVIDVGRTNVTVLATRQSTVRKVSSGESMTARKMVPAVRRLITDWSYDVTSLGYPGACGPAGCGTQELGQGMDRV